MGENTTYSWEMIPVGEGRNHVLGPPSLGLNLPQVNTRGMAAKVERRRRSRSQPLLCRKWPSLVASCNSPFSLIPGCGATLTWPWRPSFILHLLLVICRKEVSSWCLEQRDTTCSLTHTPHYTMKIHDNSTINTWWKGGQNIGEIHISSHYWPYGL